MPLQTSITLLCEQLKNSPSSNAATSTFIKDLVLLLRSSDELNVLLASLRYGMEQLTSNRSAPFWSPKIDSALLEPLLTKQLAMFEAIATKKATDFAPNQPIFQSLLDSDRLYLCPRANTFLTALSSLASNDITTLAALATAPAPSAQPSPGSFAAMTFHSTNAKDCQRLLANLAHSARTLEQTQFQRLNNVLQNALSCFAIIEQHQKPTPSASPT